MPNLSMMTAKAELLELVNALDDQEAASVLDTLQAASFRVLLASAEEVEPDRTEIALLADITDDDLKTATPLDADFKRRLGIA